MTKKHYKREKYNTEELVAEKSPASANEQRSNNVTKYEPYDVDATKTTCHYYVSICKKKCSTWSADLDLSCEKVLIILLNCNLELG